MPTSTRGRDPAVEEEFLGALYKGGELLASGKIVEAREHLERAHGLSPKNEKAQNLLGLTYFKLGLYDQAAQVYEKLVDENPVDATLRVNLGLVFLKTNSLERCIKEFETATDLEPTHKKAHNYLGLALAQQGLYARAKEHFVLAGSEPMADKMERALASQAQSQPAPPPSRPSAQTVVIGGEPPPPPVEEEQADAPPEVQSPDDSIEVMTDEELPSDVYVVPEENSAPDPVQETPSGATTLEDDWGAQLAGAPDDDRFGLSKTSAPVESNDEMRFAEDEGPGESELTAPAPLPLTEPVQTTEELPMLEGEVEVDVDTPAPSSAAPAWLTMEAAEAERAVEEAPPEGAWNEPAVVLPAEDGATWVEEPRLDDEPSAVEEPVVPPDASFAMVDGGSFEATAAAVEAPQQLTAEDSRWSEPQELPSVIVDDSSWATEPLPESEVQLDAPPPEPLAEVDAWANAPADDDSWATGGADVSAVAVETQWATEQMEGVYPTPLPQPEPPPEEPIALQTVALEPMPQQVWQPAVAQVEEEPAYQEEPQQPAWEPPPQPPAGYAPMLPQRLGDLGASGNWVQEPSSGPFHISTDGLAVTVAGEMLSRLEGFIAMTGSVEVAPENRRRRGRSTSEPFGSGAMQVQRLKGNGVVYLESGRAHFHAVDLTDQNGVSIDDDGAYLREDLVFAFEEPIFFENGIVSGEGQSIEMVHLKGTGRVLLQLEGTLRAMPIPTGAPLVVPLHRVVGWFGRVTPRLKGFGGRGALELTGEGYALLGTPIERA